MNKDTARPAWLERAQLRWAWLAWEPLAMFRRHGGRFETVEAAAHWVGDWFDRIHSEPFIESLADAGFNCITTHFHKGFGMVAEAEEMQRTCELIEICHRHGIRVLTYVQSMSIMPETFYEEVAEANQWLQVDEHGHPRTYAEQYWRLFPCLSHSGYIAYIKRVVERAIDWAQADGIWLDNTNFTACGCAACHEGFSHYLREHHDPPDITRFGIPSLEHVELPICGRTYDPIYQEAMRYRCQTLTRFVWDMRAYVRSLNPNAVVAANYGIPSPYNIADMLGVDTSDALRAADVSLVENGNFPEYLDGHAVTQILGHKMGRATDTVIVPSHWRLEDTDSVEVTLPTIPAHVKLTLAESAAFGRQCVGSTWACRPTRAGTSTLLERGDILPIVKRYHSFLSKHERLFAASQSASRVATYRNYASEAFTHEKFTQSVLGFEQALIHDHVPFDVVFAQDLAAVSAEGRIRVLILANVMCMSDDELAIVNGFVASGGAVVATGCTSLYDENYRQRRDYGLMDLFGVSYHDIESNRVYWNGRVIFTPQTLEAVDFNHLNYQLRPVLPESHERLTGFVRELDPEATPIRIEHATAVVVELCTLDQTTTIHLINYANAEPAGNIRVHVAAAISSNTHVELISPDLPDVLQPRSERDDSGDLIVEIDALDTYALLLLKPNS